MERNTPPSPAPSKTEPLKPDTIPSGFHELIQHNNSLIHPSYPQRESVGIESIHAHSQPGSRYGTPVPQHGHENMTTTPYHRAGSGQLQQQGYHQSMYSQDSSPYGPVPEQHHPYSTPATSPPTPSRASEIKTRSGNVIHKAAHSSKALAPKRAAVEKSAPKKSNKGGKKPARNGASKEVQQVMGPLSELTKESKIELTDIEAYVNRPIEERHHEIETGKNPGRVKRPMNAFMLYRKAYQQRAKEYVGQHNHQIVSSVCGTSWRLEPKAYQERFKDWAELERENHRRAYPDYKFAPAKTKPKPKAADSDSEEDLPPAAFDYRGTPGRGQLDPDYTPPRSVYGLPSYAYGGGLSPHNRSAFEFTNPGKQLPQPYDHRELGGTSYYETHVQRQPRMHRQGVVEDVMLHKTPSPGLSFSPTHRSLYSHPGLPQYSTHSPAMQAQPLPPPQQQQPPRFEHRIDPSLIGHEGAMYNSDNMGNLFFEGNMQGSQQAWVPSLHLPGGHETEGHFAESYLSGGGGGGLDETLSVEQQTQFLRGANEWEIEPLTDASQFDASWAEASHKAEG